MHFQMESIGDLWLYIANTKCQRKNLYTTNGKMLRPRSRFLWKPLRSRLRETKSLYYGFITPQ